MKRARQQPLLLAVGCCCFQLLAFVGARKTAISLGEAVSLHQSERRDDDAAGDTEELFDRGTDCFSHQCSEGFVPKKDKAKITGSSDEVCCEKTCFFHNCGVNYTANSAYFGNVAASDAECCDQTCEAVSCPLQFKVPAARKNSVGLTVQDCCEQTCALVVCPVSHDHVDSNYDSTYPAGNATDFCCEPTCAAFTCPSSQGLGLKTETLALRNPSITKCCGATCSSQECPNGYKMPDELADVVATGNACCNMTCASYQCLDDWSADSSRSALFGQTDEVCCTKKCSIYSCSVGWTRNTDNNDFIGVDDATCCLKTCLLHQHNCTGDYAPSASKESKVGSSAEDCCQHRCSLHNCAAGVRIPDAVTVVGDSDSVCCEPRECPTFRNKTWQQEHGCNSLQEEACNNSYTILFNTDTSQFDALSCFFNLQWEVCLTGPAEPRNCSNFSAETIMKR